MVRIGLAIDMQMESPQYKGPPTGRDRVYHSKTAERVDPIQCSNQCVRGLLVLPLRPPRAPRLELAADLAVTRRVRLLRLVVLVASRLRKPGSLSSKTPRRKR
jgi:hypothetical protein